MEFIADIYRRFNHPVLLIILIIINVPIYRFLSELIFGRNGGLSESISYWLTPDITSAFRGEWINDRWAETKLLVYAVVCVLCVAAEYTGLSKLILLFSR
jgi:hypothetical protein